MKDQKPADDPSASDKDQAIKFKDCVGRKFVFPWKIAKTWNGMKELIDAAFLHVEEIGPHVHQGHFDLIGPDGEIILPTIWNAMIEPGMAIAVSHHL
jgi:hypothetical protein